MVFACLAAPLIKLEKMEDVFVLKEIKLLMENVHNVQGIPSMWMESVYAMMETIQLMENVKCCHVLTLIMCMTP